MKKCKHCGGKMTKSNSIKYCSTKCAYEVMAIKAKERKQEPIIARMVIKNLPELTTVDEQRLFQWLKEILENLRETSKKEFAKNYKLTLYK